MIFKEREGLGIQLEGIWVLKFVNMFETKHSIALKLIDNLNWWPNKQQNGNVFGVFLFGFPF